MAFRLQPNPNIPSPFPGGGFPGTGPGGLGGGFSPNVSGLGGLQGLNQPQATTATTTGNYLSAPLSTGRGSTPGGFSGATLPEVIPYPADLYNRINQQFTGTQQQAGPLLDQILALEAQIQNLIANDPNFALVQQLLETIQQRANPQSGTFEFFGF